MRGHPRRAPSVASLILSIALGLPALAASPARAGAPLAALVPAYANPCCAGGLSMWPDLIASAASGPVEIHAILNPASGPGATPIDPNYVNVGGAGPAVDLVTAGGRLYGYVATTFGTRPLGTVQAEIDLYYDTAYWRGAGILVSGIFLDEMSNDIADAGYYQALSVHVHALDPAARVFGNPGTTFTQDTSGGTSGFDIDDYATSVDTIVTFENTGAAYRTSYSPPAWLSSLGAEHFAHIVHGEASSLDMQDDVALARSRKARFVYVTDDILPNPFDALASYWPLELAALASPAVPALGPGAGLALIGSMAYAGLRAFRSRSR